MRQHPVWNALSHITVIGSAMFIIFFCIDRVNPAMDFLGSDLSKWFLFAYCIASLVTALCSAVYLFKRSKSSGKHRLAHRHAADEDAYAGEAHPVRRMRELEDVGRHGASGNDPRYAYLARGRETLHDTRYETVR